jgi:hypothetical protein
LQDRHTLGDTPRDRRSARRAYGPQRDRAFGQRLGLDLSGAVKWLDANQARLESTAPDVKAFFDNRTFSVQYVVSDPATKQCAIIDPVLDFDEKSGATATINADRILDYIESRG